MPLEKCGTGEGPKLRRSCGAAPPPRKKSASSGLTGPNPPTNPAGLSSSFKTGPPAFRSNYPIKHRSIRAATKLRTRGSNSVFSSRFRISSRVAIRCRCSDSTNSMSFSRPATSFATARSCTSKHHPRTNRVFALATLTNRPSQPAGNTAVSGPTPCA